MGHAIRHMMTPMLNAKLSGIVELDETYVGGNPRYQLRYCIYILKVG